MESLYNIASLFKPNTSEQD